MLLFEVFNSTVPYQFSPDERMANFKIGDKSYFVEFFTEDPTGLNIDVTFGLNTPSMADTYKITNTGNEYQVLATVLAIIMEYVGKNTVRSVTFGANNLEGVKKPSPDGSQRDPSRVSLYKRMVQQYAGRWQVTIRDTPAETIFILTNPDIPVNPKSTAAYDDVPF